MLLRGDLQKDAKKSNFNVFKSTLFMKSGSMPLNILNTGKAEFILERKAFFHRFLACTVLFFDFKN